MLRKLRLPCTLMPPAAPCTWLWGLQGLHSFSTHAFNIDHFSYLVLIFMTVILTAVLLEWSDIVICFSGSPLEGGLFMFLVRAIMIRMTQNKKCFLLQINLCSTLYTYACGNLCGFPVVIHFSDNKSFNALLRRILNHS